MFSSHIKMCFDKILPHSERIAAAERAIRENAENLPGRPATPHLGVALRADQPLEMALVTGKKWRNGRTLRVAFLGGERSVQQRVMSYAVEWMNYANIRLEFVNDPAADIRVAFYSGDGSWSYLGTDAMGIAPGEATMNYGWLTPDTPDEEYSRVVLHEFGHALGCIHEHQHPEAGIPWDREAVYRYYWRTQGWTRPEVDNNLFNLLPASQTQFSRFDPTSIMCYAVPNDLTLGDYEIGWNRTLSPTDKDFIGAVYPKTVSNDIELQMNASPVAARIGRHQEVDRFRITIVTHGTYVMETHGLTDVVMTLAGPCNPDHVIVEDDDTGEGRNAKIVEPLAPGLYYVRVRHYSPRGTGNYQIGVRQE